MRLSPLAADFKLRSSVRLDRVSKASSNSTAYFEVWDTQSGARAKRLIGRTIMFKGRQCRIMAAKARIRVPLCTRCYRWGHPTSACRAFHVQCPLCCGPHDEASHRFMCAGCRGAPNANPPVLGTPPGAPCPHKKRCPNCKGEHSATDRKACPFWRHCYDHEWIEAKYAQVRGSSPQNRPARSNPPPPSRK